MGESCPILSTDVVLQPFLKLEEQPALMKGADLDAFMYRLKVLRCPKAGPPRSVCLVHRAVYIYREEVKKQCAHRLIGHWWHPARHPASTYLYVYLPYRVSRLWISNASLASQPCDPGHGLHHLDGALDRDPWPVGGELGPKLYICERIELIFGNYMRMCMTCKMLLYIPYIYIYIHITAERSSCIIDPDQGFSAESFSCRSLTVWSSMQARGTWLAWCGCRDSERPNWISFLVRKWAWPKGSTKAIQWTFSVTPDLRRLDSLLYIKRKTRKNSTSEL